MQKRKLSCIVVSENHYSTGKPDLLIARIPAMIRRRGMARALSSLIARYGEQQVQLLHYEQTG